VTDALEKKAVLLFTTFQYPHVGGVSSHIDQLARVLGFDPARVLSASQRDRMDDGRWGTIRAAGSRLLFALRGATRLEREALSIARVLTRSSCRIVHCHDVLAAWAAVQVRDSERPELRVVVTVHGPNSRHMREEGDVFSAHEIASMERRERETWGRVDRIIAVDSTQAAILREQGADSWKIDIIPNAVDVTRTEQIGKALQVHAAPGRSWVCVPRRLVPKNGVDVAIEAHERLGDPSIDLLICGDGPLRGHLERKAARGSQRDAVHFLGSVAQALLFPIIVESRAVLVPSVPVYGIVEATSLSALETMALARPVIASNIGGLSEIIEDRESGMLVPPGNANDLARALEGILRSPVMHAMLCDGGRRRVTERFSVGRWAAEHRRVYSLLG